MTFASSHLNWHAHVSFDLECAFFWPFNNKEHCEVKLNIEAAHKRSETHRRNAYKRCFSLTEKGCSPSQSNHCF